MSENVILVPIDFSSVALSAIVHAGVIAKKNKQKILLVHILTKEINLDIQKGKKSIENISNALETLCTEYGNKFEVEINWFIKNGSIFSDIGELASEKKASLIVMGTHGVKGMQHITGAYAIKVIASSKVPIIIVQHKHPVGNLYHTILVPIDSSADNRQKAVQTLSMAHIFGAQVHLFKMYENDPKEEDKMLVNLNYFIRFLEDHDIAYIIANQENKTNDFAKSFLKYAKDNRADLIIILTTAEKGLFDAMLGPVEQMVINNSEQIPVMCVNPLQSIYKKSDA